MAQSPDGVSFVVQSKQLNQTKWQTEDTFEVDSANGYMEGNAQEAATALFNSVVAGHTGGAKEYRLMRCAELVYEQRPV